MKILLVVKPNSHNFIRHYAGAGLLLVTDEVEDVRQMIEGYDVIIYEWANHFTAKCLNSIDHTGKKVVVRVHDHEVRKGRVNQIKWNGVRAWFINEDIRTEFHARYFPGVRSFYLPNAIDPQHFTLSEKKEKRVGFLSIYCRKRKRPDRALELAKLCPEWEFVFRMSSLPVDSKPGEGMRYWEYIRDTALSLPNVILNIRSDEFTRTGYPLDDVNHFWQDKAVGLSTSEHEGFHYSIPQSALCGAMPLVYNWETGNPRQFWKPYVFDTIQEMADVLNNTRIEDMKPAGFRRWVLDRYSPEVLIPQLKEKLETI